MWRQTSIHNALSYLDASFDRALYERTHEAVLEATGDKERAEAAAWAAVIGAAVRDDSAAPPSGAPARLTARAPDPSALLRIADALTAPLPAPPRHVPTDPTPTGTA